MYDTSGDQGGRREPGPLYGDGAERARVLADLADLFGGDADVADALQQIAREAVRLTAADAASLFLYNEVGEFERAASDGLSTRISHELEKLGRTEWVGQYLVTGKKPLVLEIPRGTRQPSPIHRLASVEGMAQIVAVPLLFGQRLTGLLLLYHRAVCAYSPADFDFLRAFASFVALSFAHSSLVQTRKWERKAQDGFLDALGHELRTPLTSILGFTQLVRKRVNDSANGDGRMRDQLELIWAQAQRMNRLLDTFVDVANMERGEFIIEHGQLELVDILNRAVTHARVQNRSRLEITLLAPDKLIMVPGDSRRLEHVFSHLISNAIKYSPVDHPVTVLCQEYPAKHEVAISITDRGHGISADLHKEIFKRFFPSGTRKAGGMGMGLYASRAIVEAHGGRLTLISEPGKGTVVTVTLPVDE
jgi:signal transduction histidine kinase